LHHAESVFKEEVVVIFIFFFFKTEADRARQFKEQSRQQS
jgi:hypothetical protein